MKGVLLLTEARSGSGWLGSAADGTAEELVMTSVELTVDYK